jgi:hypothetical protein
MSSVFIVMLSAAVLCKIFRDVVNFTYSTMKLPFVPQTPFGLHITTVSAPRSLLVPIAKNDWIITE